MEIRYYAKDSWMVSRWDKLSGGKEPTSFCQFWRTVLLWATLASIPLVGKLFTLHWEIEHKQKVPPTEEEERKRIARHERILSAIFPLAKLVWLLLWPIRMVVLGVWRIVETISSYVDERSTLSRTFPRLGTAFVAITLAVGVASLGALIIMLLIQAWQANWQAFVIVLGSVIVGIPALVAMLLQYGQPVATAFLDICQLVWHVAVTSKRRICPQMTIVRSNTDDPSMH